MRTLTVLTVQWKKSKEQMCLNAVSGPLSLCPLLTRYDTNATLSFYDATVSFQSIFTRDTFLLENK